METMTVGTLIAVFEEIFGRGLFWVLVMAAAVVTIAYLYVLIRDRAMSMRKFLLAQLSMPFGAVAAVLFVQAMTSSHLRDIGGPVDWVLVALIFVLGTIGATVGAYALLGVMRRLA